MCSKFNFIAIFLILANFAAFLDHTKENADVSKNDGYFQANFYIYRKYMPEAFSTPNLVLLPITSQELDRGAFLPPSTKIVLSNSPTTTGWFAIKVDDLHLKWLTTNNFKITKH